MSAEVDIEESSLGIYISIGTYEKALLVYRFSPIDDEPLDLIFSQKLHEGMIRTVSNSGPFVATGSSDESVRVLNLRNKSDRVLDPHGGYVEDCTFFLTSHFFSCGKDGKIKIYQTKDFGDPVVLETKKSINSISVHPSGKILASVDSNNHLICWNLATGKPIIRQPMPKPAIQVLWSSTGIHYGILRAQKALFYDQNGTLVSIIKHPSGFCNMTFLDDDKVALGTQDKEILIWSIQENEEVRKVEFHESRVKCVAAASVEDIGFLVSTDSNGVVAVWSVETLLDKEAEPSTAMLMAFETKSRITCLSVCSITSPEEEKEALEKDKKTNRKRKREQPEVKEKEKKTRPNKKLKTENQTKKTKNKKPKKRKKKSKGFKEVRAEEI